LLNNDIKRKVPGLFKTSTDIETEDDLMSSDSVTGDTNSLFDGFLNGNHISNNNNNNSQIENKTINENTTSMFTKPDSLLKKYNIVPAGYLKIGKPKQKNTRH
jgi:hypothetical protein